MATTLQKQFLDQLFKVHGQQFTFVTDGTAGRMFYKGGWDDGTDCWCVHTDLLQKPAWQIAELFEVTGLSPDEVADVVEVMLGAIEAMFKAQEEERARLDAVGARIVDVSPRLMAMVKARELAAAEEAKRLQQGGEED